MSRISNFIPLPGFPEFESLTRSIANFLKDADLQPGKGVAFARRLGSLIEHATKLESRTEFARQLLEIQRQFKEASVPSPRLWIRGARRKLMIWDDLTAQPDKVVELHMLDLLTEKRQVQTQLVNTRPRRYKAKTLEGWRIKSQVEIHTEGFPTESTFKTGRRRLETIETSLCSGRIGDLFVTYVKFVTDPEDVVHELVAKEMEQISQSIHINVAQLVGGTEGCGGLNGIVVVTEGIDFREFVSGIHSGAVWAKCLRAIEGFQESVSVRRITVTLGGHVTVFPSGFIRGRPVIIRTFFVGLR